jgi:hypothetical protein
MNIVEWHQAFKVQLATLDTQGGIRLQPEVVDIFFNKAINKVIIDLYDSYEETQGLSDALSSQILTVKCSTHLVGGNEWEIDFPSDYYHHLQSKAFLMINNNSNNLKQVRTVKQLLDNETKVLSNPFERPDDTEIPLFFKNSKMYVYVPDDYPLHDFYLTYLKNPKKVSYKQYIATNTPPINPPDNTWTSDIDEYLHERIINLAVIYALETYGSERTAAKVQIKDVN